jgi:hypothetical protein
MLSHVVDGLSQRLDLQVLPQNSVEQAGARAHRTAWTVVGALLVRLADVRVRPIA